jgi:hypothetical protein
MARKRSADGSQAADVIRGVLETFYPDGGGAAPTSKAGMTRARRSDPGQDPSMLAVVQTDYVASVTETTPKKKSGKPHSAWAEQTKKNLLAALREAKAGAKGAQRDAIQEAIAHIEARWR